MIQRLGIADVLVKDPRVVILDEPTNGIDPEGIREVLELIHGLSREDGRTVLISSHLLHQVQQICDRVGIFVEGKLVAAGPIESLGEQLLAGQPVMLEVQAQPGGERLRAVLEELEGIQRLENKADYLLAYCTEDIRSRLVELLHSRGFALLHLRRRGYSLDDIYRMYFTRGGGEEV
jgi:ABC-2 type transport system ATP-binding protein